MDGMSASLLLLLIDMPIDQASCYCLLLLQLPVICVMRSCEGLAIVEWEMVSVYEMVSACMRYVGVSFKDLKVESNGSLVRDELLSVMFSNKSCKSLHLLDAFVWYHPTA